MSAVAAPSGFTAAAFDAFIAERKEPVWLKQLRRAAWKRFEEMPLPSRREEEWMRTDIRLFKWDNYTLPQAVAGATGEANELPALLAQHKPTHVLIELGGNDALRGLPLASTRDNLAAMARTAKAAGARVVLIGMQVPPNYGRAYAEEFARSFATAAKAEGAALVPFLLKGVADVPDSERLFQPDRIHPKEAAHPIMLDNVWPVLVPLLPDARRTKPR